MLFQYTTKSLLKFASQCVLQNPLIFNLVKSYSNKFGKRNSPSDGKYTFHDVENQDNSPLSSTSKPHSVGSINIPLSADKHGIESFGKQTSECSDETSNQTTFNLQDFFAIRSGNPLKPKLMETAQVKPVTSVGNRAKFSTKTSKCNKNPGRHQYHEECECALSQQIFAELNAAMAYLSMACYFGRTDIALPGCQGFFIKMHEEEMGHAMQFINYQLMRGGKVYWFPISIPDSEEFDSVVKAFSVATEMEKLVKEKIQCVHDTAEKHRDLQMQDYMVKFLQEQNESICEMARLQVRAGKMCEDCAGEFLFDKELFEGWVRKDDKNAVYK